MNEMCNLYSITTNQAAIIALFRVINRYVGNLPPMPGVFPDYPAPVVCNTDSGRALTKMRWACRHRRAQEARRSPTSARQSSPHWRGWPQAGKSVPSLDLLCFRPRSSCEADAT